MLRKDIEDMLKSKNQKSITLVFNQDDPLGMYCFLQGGYLVDCWGKRVNRFKSIWGYIDWDGKGNADRVCFATQERFPLMRGGFKCENS